MYELWECGRGRMGPCVLVPVLLQTNKSSLCSEFLVEHFLNQFQVSCFSMELLL